jgi:thiamine-phosphate pyrophosphorylase
VAIGGITSRNAQALIDAGVDSVAVISALFDAEDIERRAREFAAIFDTHGLEKRSLV